MRRGSKTINGLITEYLDQIPQENLCLEIEDYRIEILELEDNLIEKVKLKKRRAKALLIEFFKNYK